MGKKKKKENGSELFDEFYRSIYKERWDDLKSALLAPKSHVVLKNPYSNEPLLEASPFHDLENMWTTQKKIENPKVDELTQENSHTPFYFMDGASAFAAYALEVKEGDEVLDLCAAPGGKALILAYALKGTGRLVANDKSTDRRLRLHSVLKKSLPESIFQECIKVTGNDAGKWCLYEKEAFTKILLDAPCSSESHVLSSPQHLKEWRLNRTKKLSVNQWTMLASAWLVLKPGGRLVYSTCSISNLENDDVVAKLFKKFPNEVKKVDSKIPVGESTQYGHIILPDKSGLGPIYLAVIEKTASSLA
jgi:16S rRNA C967 or C1407 C5-methylase (RsmB/RsmF family)